MLAPLAYPPSSAEGIVTLKLMIALYRANWLVDVITLQESGIHYAAHESFTPSQVKDHIHFVKGANPKTFLGMSRISGICWAVKASLLAAKLQASVKYDAILTRTMPQFGHLPGIFLSLCKPTPWIASWSDPMPAQKAPHPYGGGPDAPTPRITSLFCRCATKRAGLHVFPSNQLRDYMAAYLPGLRGKSQIIPHVALAGITPNMLPDPNRFTLCHAGSLEKKDVFPFLTGVQRFLKMIPFARTQLRLRFVGHSGAELLKAIETVGLESITDVRGVCSYQETLGLLAGSDIGLLIEARMKNGIFLPSKAIDILQSGRPILSLSPKIGTMATLIGSLGGGIVASNEDPEEIAVALKPLYTAWSAGCLAEAYSINRFLEHCSEKRVEVLYDSIVGSLCE